MNAAQIEVGSTAVNFYPGAKYLFEPRVDETFRNKKYGLALYVAASSLIGPGDTSPPLCAAPYLRTMAATRVWQSLVRRGFAIENGHDAAQPYRFTGMFSLPEPMPAAGQGS